ncbi:MAG: hypothetical protein IT293_09845 [Deltaproteobacteria bacterium]|nr:hypothetical protein [Deltaproteobacteria bacterium]
MARRLILAFVPAAILLVAAVETRLLAARPEAVWLLAWPPIAALAVGPRTRAIVMAALVELALLVPLHAFVTLLRAARLEGG